MSEKNWLVDLIGFTMKCKQHGYYNNASIDRLKVKWCVDNGGTFFATYLDDTLVSISGCHALPEVDDKTYRILYRGATLPEAQNFQGVMNKYHMNSIPFFYHVPKHIEWARERGAEKFIITTNWDNQDIPTMEKSHRAFKVLEKRGIVTCLSERVELFHTEQTLWELNLEKYFELREEYRLRNNISDDV